MNNSAKFKPLAVAQMAAGALLSLAAFSCVKLPTEPPVLPQSSIQMTIPVIDRIRTVADLYGKPSSGIKYDSTVGTYVYTSYQSSTPQGINSMNATPKPQSSVVSLGTFSVTGLPTQTGSVTADKIFTGQSFPINYPGSPAPPFPAANATLPGVGMQDTAEFSYLHVNNGTMTVTVKNTLPMTVTFTKPLILRNNKTSLPTDNSIVASFAIDSVVSGQTVTKTANLAGILMRGDLKTDSISVSTPSKQGPFTISQSDGLSFSFSTSSLVVDSASASIPNQTLVPYTDSLFTVDDSIVVQQADFRSGSFTAQIVNQSNVTVSMYLRFNDLINIANGQPLLINPILSGKQTFSQVVNLNQYKIQTTPSALGSKLSFRLAISSIQSASKVAVASSDYIRADLLIGSPFVIKSVTGQIKPMSFAINTGAKGVNLGDASTNLNVDTVNFASQSIALELGVYSGFVMDYDLTLEARCRKVNPTKIVTMTVPPPAGSAQKRIIPTPGKLTQIVLDQSSGFSAFLNQFFPNLPDTFIVRGTVTLNPGDVFGTPAGFATIYDTSKVYSGVNVFFPMKMGISRAQYIDVVPLDFKTDSAFVANVQSGSLYFSITNGIPITFSFGSKFQGMDTVTRKRTTFFTIPANAGIQNVTGASVDANGNAKTATTTTFSISLSAKQAKQLVSTDSVAMTLQIATSGTDGTLPQPVLVNASDQIRVRASANMVFTLKENR